MFQIHKCETEGKRSENRIRIRKQIKREMVRKCKEKGDIERKSREERKGQMKEKC